MLETIHTGERFLEAYRATTPREVLEGITSNAEELQGLRVLHLNATPHGGAVSDLLRSLVPLLTHLGLVADWKIVGGDDSFHRVGRALHNGLQGAGPGLNEEGRSAYLEASRRNAALLGEVYDVIFVHDAQPVAMLPLHGKGKERWVWRCHVDASEPHPEIWDFLVPYLSAYDAAVFTHPDLIPPDLPTVRVTTIPPAIDPLNPRNVGLDEKTARQLLEWVGIRLDRPLITQIARFDLWKDPLWTIAAFELARTELPQAQLAVVGFISPDDPEAWAIYRKVQSRAFEDPRIHIVTNLSGVGNMEVNAFQRLSDVIVQKSVREGFGLCVSEALWKGTPVVAGRAGGIPLQMADGSGGVLVDSLHECAAAIVDLLRDPGKMRELGQSGKERVRRHFLLPRLLLNELLLMRELVSDRSIGSEPTPDYPRDPACGMVITPERPAIGEEGLTEPFCSEDCRVRFMQSPRGAYRPSVGELSAG